MIAPRLAPSGLATLLAFVTTDARTSAAALRPDLADWPGRGLHFHWFHDPNDPDPESPGNKAIDLVYQQKDKLLYVATYGRSLWRTKV